MRYYHGTTSADINSILQTGLIAGINFTEDRSKNLNVVFLTSSWQSALGYAGRSRKQRGGERIVLEVEVEAKPWKNKSGCSIFLTEHVAPKNIKEVHYI